MVRRHYTPQYPKTQIQTVSQLEFGNQSEGKRAQKQIIGVFSLFGLGFEPKVEDLLERIPKN